MTTTDTITAIATPVGEGGIAVIRLSGPEAIQTADLVFGTKRGKLVSAATHTVHYGHIVNPRTGETLDEVLVTIMRGPRSFTREDVVEISCHGGIISVKRVLDLLLEQGIRLAEPGEFTKRAFLNGRIDLSQAEAVIDTIRAKSDRAHKLAMKQVEGGLSKQIEALQQKLIELMAHIEVNIDYPEHDVEEMTYAFIRRECEETMVGITELLRTANQGKVLREGITTAIIGKPNVGKSSLLNALARENKAIVTDIAGTTRDVIEEFVSINGIPLRLLDTAGMRETTDVVEKIGVERSRDALAQADLLLLVLNNNEPTQPDEYELMEHVKDRQTIVIVNKMDLPSKFDMQALHSTFSEDRVVKMSVIEGEGLQELERAITDLFFEGNLEGQDLTYVSNARHIHLLKQGLASLAEAVQAVEELIPIDMIQIDVRNAWESLGEIIGNAAPDALIDQIFSQFCLGK
ncbi:tRNA uridine-5-carboxymethylaminomethyl(34) synthesis GTPase MnmE [Paenibacillus sp. y28]|uniref:tRNA uridine-5-carboxymethylaminomethyl(34) synthesis GTPase MnmE n=1 Tax=Paenibacillus sp. y28 TaxID=3129110 RepID=UPI00301A12FB